jgi:membrane associated rhomboid family serine protease
MGIYDRDYIRREPPRPGAYGGGGVRAMRMWSVNTWIIVICVAVFVIDVFLPHRWVGMTEYWRTDLPVAIDRSQVRGDQIQVTQRDRYGNAVLGLRNLYIMTNAGPVQVGQQRMQSMPLLQSFLHFSTSRGFLRIEFWRLIGFQFLHANITHILFNMIGLYFFGPMVERYLGSKRYLAFYLLCGIFGALLYGVLNLGGAIAHMFLGSEVKIAGLLFEDIHTPLIGASAGVFGVLMAGAFLAPRATVLLFFFLPMQLRTLAYALVAVAFVTVLVGGNNAGGEAGHLGGAIAGFYFIRHPKHLHGFFDFLGRVDPTSHHYRGKGAPARGRAVAKSAQQSGSPNRAEVDRILDKVHSQGLASLTDREKRILREASEEGG